MAEIKIEKKSSKWPWIILVLAIIAIAIYFLAFTDDDDDIDRTADTTQVQEEPMQTAADNSTVSTYVSFIQGDPDQMGLDHEFTNEALMKLTNATEAMADEIDYDIQKDIEKVRALAKKIEEDPFETTHANSIREAANILAAALQRMQQNAFSGLATRADQVKSAAMNIETDVLTLDQKGDVKTFFREAADLLEEMNTNTPEI
ncbi:MAG TPA: hypothetical protein VJ949_07360 [Cryomorphaceae bacterium]|nr:hypothetical protein [Cryomorphaceae bacterium]